MTSDKMTPEAAIIELNRCKVSGYMPTDWERRSQAVNMAIAAMNKQIQALPKSIKYSNGSGVVECPICGEREGVCNWEPNYCPNCGQALDWGTK